jgi:putative transposase
LRPRLSRASGQPRTLPAWTLPATEREEIRSVLCEDRFGDLAPAQVYATLLDEGRYLLESRLLVLLLGIDEGGEVRR